MSLFPTRTRALELLARLGGRLPSWGNIILGGRRVPVPGAVAVNWTDGGCIQEATDTTIRRHAPQNITIHTEDGEPRDPPVTSGAVTSHACRLARYQVTSAREVAWDFFVASMGFLVQQNDPVFRYTSQAGNVNGYSLGVETEQGAGGAVDIEAIHGGVSLYDTLTRELGIARQVPAILVGGRLVPDRRVLARFAPGHDGATWIGLEGHRNICACRGPGDPGDAIMQALLDAGYEGFDLASWEDFEVWRARQAVLGVPQTGMPDAATLAALKRNGIKHGMMVWRPGD
jgi:hypothetical protein